MATSLRRRIVDSLLNLHWLPRLKMTSMYLALCSFQNEEMLIPKYSTTRLQAESFSFSPGLQWLDLRK